MNRVISIDPDRLADRESLKAYMKDIFGCRKKISFGDGEEDDSANRACLAGWTGNLDALSDMLSEVRQDTCFRVSRESLRKICGDDFGYRVLCLLSAAAEENPYISLRITR